MSIKISIIVPVYKVEQYLRKCIDSILAQTFSRFELILVDDGSPDSCGDICDAYAQKDKRVKVIHKANQGVSSARNAGIDLAAGEYIGFVDSDDWIPANYYEELYNCCIRNNADICECSINCVDENDKTVYVNSMESTSLESKAALEKLFSYEKIMNAAWDKLYKSALFNNIRYPDGKIYEDLSTTYKLIYKAGKIYYTDNTQYYYLQRSSSIMGQSSIAANVNLVEAIDKILVFAKSHIPDIYQKTFSGQFISAFNRISQVVKLDPELINKSDKEYFYGFQKLCRKYRRDLYSNRTINRNIKILSLLLSYNRKIFVLIYKMLLMRNNNESK